MASQQDTESKIAFLEKAHDDLNDVVLQQQRDIERLSLIVEGLRSRLKQSTEDGVESDPANERPPHY